MKQNCTIDGKSRVIEIEIRYKILKGTQVWLVIGVQDKAIITERDVIYTAEDIEMDLSKEYHFKLPPNDKWAVTLIVKKVNVIEIERAII